MNRGQKTLQEYKSINDLLPLHFIIQIFQKSFMSFANHKHQTYFYSSPEYLPAFNF